MATIHIRDVDDEVQQRLAERAAAEGLSLAELVRRMVEREASQPSPRELDAQLAQRRAAWSKAGYPAMSWEEYDRIERTLRA